VIGGHSTGLLADRKTIDQLLSLLQVLDCEIDLVVRTKTA